MDPSDYAEIAQLLARYCHIVDGKHWDRLLEIFADDGTMTVTNLYETHRGDAELRVLYGEIMNHPLAHHSTSVVVLEASGTTAVRVRRPATRAARPVRRAEHSTAFVPAASRIVATGAKADRLTKGQ